MRRHLFTFLSVVSLVLCLCACGVHEWTQYQPKHRQIAVDFGDPYTSSEWVFIFFGGMHFERLWEHREVRSHDTKESVERQSTDWNQLGIYYDEGPFIESGNGNAPGTFGKTLNIEITAPTLIAITCALPIFQFSVLLYRRRNLFRRHSHGECRICGYDLRATPDRCPECGAVPKKVTA